MEFLLLLLLLLLLLFCSCFIWLNKWNKTNLTSQAPVPFSFLLFRGKQQYEFVHPSKVPDLCAFPKPIWQTSLSLGPAVSITHLLRVRFLGEFLMGMTCVTCLLSGPPYNLHGPGAVMPSWVPFSIRKKLKIISYYCVGIKTHIIQAGLYSFLFSWFSCKS